MKQATEGSTVKVHYTGKLDDGTVFDSSLERDPLEFHLGKQQVIAGFEQAVVGMAPGEKKTVTLPPEQGYGPHRGELLIEVERAALPETVDPAEGQPLRVKAADGRELDVRVTKVEKDMVTLDANHPLAGKELTFEIELVDVKK